jgi:HAE1 family hydrophobic/amphiphilic exporter-1
VALVSSNLRGVDLGTAVKEVQQLVREHPLGADVRLAFGGQSEELDSSIRSLLFAFGLAIFLVYLVMASQFESLLHPFVIMFSVPAGDRRCCPRCGCRARRCRWWCSSA